MGTLGAVATATPAAAAPCDQSDAIVIGSSTSWSRSYPTQSGNLGTLSVKYSSSCNTEWAYLELNDTLSPGEAAHAQYDNWQNTYGCNVAVGSTACSTTPRPVVCGVGVSTTIGYKDTISNGRWYVGGAGIPGVHC
ncbi:hypothetical protein FrEUN1fDRAFT_2970 [Parafrankia sp. EUN1f]|nr:hypothetical protein FrEUN1fDRAFT_2970 [Parafrankia sp. EUN1f]